MVRSCTKIHKIWVTDISDLEPEILSLMIFRLIFGTDNQILGTSIQDFQDLDHRFLFAEPLFNEYK